MKNRRSHREISFIKSGLTGLKLVEFIGRGDGKKNIYRCTLCDCKIGKSKFVSHFHNHHSDTYRLIAELPRIWGLIDTIPSVVEVFSHERFQCSCGLIFNSNGSLFNHRMKEGHKTILQAQKEIEITV